MIQLVHQVVPGALSIPNLSEDCHQFYSSNGFNPFQLVYELESIFPIECEILSLKLVVELLLEMYSLEECLIHLEHLDE